MVNITEQKGSTMELLQKMWKSAQIADGKKRHGLG